MSALDQKPCVVCGQEVGHWPVCQGCGFSQRIFTRPEGPEVEEYRVEIVRARREWTQALFQKWMDRMREEVDPDVWCSEDWDEAQVLIKFRVVPDQPPVLLHARFSPLSEWSRDETAPCAAVVWRGPRRPFRVGTEAVGVSASAGKERLWLWFRHWMKKQEPDPLDAAHVYQSEAEPLRVAREREELTYLSEDPEQFRLLASFQWEWHTHTFEVRPRETGGCAEAVWHSGHEPPFALPDSEPVEDGAESTERLSQKILTCIQNLSPSQPREPHE